MHCQYCSCHTHACLDFGTEEGADRPTLVARERPQEGHSESSRAAREPGFLAMARARSNHSARLGLGLSRA
eukprot:1119771-Pyramimonas_sp.AAC.1